MSTLYVDNLRSNLSTKITVPSGNTLDVSGATFTPPAGHVIQTKYSNVGSATEFSSASWADATDFSVTITPSSSSSLIRIMVYTKCICNNTSSNSGQTYRLMRGTTELDRSTYSSYLNRSDYSADFYPNLNLDVIDDPSTTSATTYKLQGRIYGGTDANWTVGSTNGGSGRGIIVAQEIAQ